MFKFATIIVLILLGIGLWFILNSLFPIIGGFFKKRGDNFVRRATEEESVELETREQLEEETKNGEKNE